MPKPVCPKCSAPAARASLVSIDAIHQAGQSGDLPRKGFAYACFYCGALLPIWPEDPRLTAPPPIPGGA